MVEKDDPTQIARDRKGVLTDPVLLALGKIRQQLDDVMNLIKAEKGPE